MKTRAALLTALILMSAPLLAQTNRQAAPSEYLEIQAPVFLPKHSYSASFLRLSNADGTTNWSLDADGSITFHNTGTVDFAGLYMGTGSSSPQPVGWVLVYAGGHPFLIPAHAIAIP